MERQGVGPAAFLFLPAKPAERLPTADRGGIKERGINAPIPA